MDALTPEQIAQFAEICNAIVNAIDPAQKPSDVCEDIVGITG